MKKKLFAKVSIGALSLGIIGMAAFASVNVYAEGSQVIAAEAEVSVDELHEQKILARTVGQETGEEWSLEIDTAESRLP